jgi:hypothetical protein
VNREHYGQLWAGVSLFLLYYAVNTWIVTQGGNEIFDAKLVTSNRVPAALVGIAICGVLMAVASIFGLLFAAGGRRWNDRIYVVWLKGLRLNTRSGDGYLGGMFFVVTLLPVLAMVHFWRLMLLAPVMDRDGNRKTDVFDWAPTIRTLNDPARICSDWIGGADPCSGSATFFPGLEPLLLGVVTAVAAAALLLNVAIVLGLVGGPVARIRSSGR